MPRPHRLNSLFDLDLYVTPGEEGNAPGRYLFKQEGDAPTFVRLELAAAGETYSVLVRHNNATDSPYSLHYWSTTDCTSADSQGEKLAVQSGIETRTGEFVEAFSNKG